MAITAAIRSNDTYIPIGVLSPVLTLFPGLTVWLTATELPGVDEPPEDTVLPVVTELPGFCGVTVGVMEGSGFFLFVIVTICAF